MPRLPKYRLTDTLQRRWDGTVLYQIEALREGWWGPTGTRGGWVQSDHNLSQDGESWIAGNAQVFDQGRVLEDACVFDQARVFHAAHIRGRARLLGDVWISGTAEVFDAVRVYGEARIAQAARIGTMDDYRVISPLGSRRAALTGYRTLTGWAVSTGCFTGTPQTFLAAVAHTHGKQAYGDEYRAATAFLRQHFERDRSR